MPPRINLENLRAWQSQPFQFVPLPEGLIALIETNTRSTYSTLKRKLLSHVRFYSRIISIEPATTWGSAPLFQ